MIGGISGCAPGALAALKKSAAPISCAIAAPLTAYCCVATNQELGKLSVGSDNHTKLFGLFLGCIFGGGTTFMLLMHILICRGRHPQQAEGVV